MRMTFMRLRDRRQRKTRDQDDRGQKMRKMLPPLHVALLSQQGPATQKILVSNQTANLLLKRLISLLSHNLSVPQSSSTDGA